MQDLARAAGVVREVQVDGVDEGGGGGGGYEEGEGCEGDCCGDRLVSLGG